MKSRNDLTQRELELIINKAEVCHVAMVDKNGMPYVLPFNFGYSDGKLYLHCAPDGKKIDIWKTNPDVCVAFSTDYELKYQSESVACSYSMKYRSVLLYGKVSSVDSIEEKERILNIVMEKYTGRNDFTYSLPAVTNVKVFEIVPSKIEGRAYGY